MSCCMRKKVTSLHLFFALTKNVHETQRKSACSDVTKCGDSSEWLRMAVFWKPRDSHNFVSCQAAPINSLAEMLHRQLFFYNDAVVYYLPLLSLIQFAHPRKRMCSLCGKRKAYLRASQPRLQGQWGGGGHTNGALRGVSRSHIQLALVHCLLAGGSNAVVDDFILCWHHSVQQSAFFRSQRASTATFTPRLVEISLREALRRWGNPGWEGCPEETRENVLMYSNFDSRL